MPCGTLSSWYSCQPLSTLSDAASYHQYPFRLYPSVTPGLSLLDYPGFLLILTRLFSLSSGFFFPRLFSHYNLLSLSPRLLSPPWPLSLLSPDPFSPQFLSPRRSLLSSPQFLIIPTACSLRLIFPSRPLLSSLRLLYSHYPGLSTFTTSAYLFSPPRLSPGSGHLSFDSIAPYNLYCYNIY